MSGSTLLHSCRCAARWSGQRTSHCSACHETFSSPNWFDRHRVAGHCVTPTEVGLSLLDRTYRCWGHPLDDEGKARLEALR